MGWLESNERRKKEIKHCWNRLDRQDKIIKELRVVHLSSLPMGNWKITGALNSVRIVERRLQNSGHSAGGNRMVMFKATYCKICGEPLRDTSENDLIKLEGMARDHDLCISCFVENVKAE